MLSTVRCRVACIGSGSFHRSSQSTRHQQMRMLAVAVWCHKSLSIADASSISLIRTADSFWELTISISDLPLIFLFGRNVPRTLKVIVGVGAMSLQSRPVIQLHARRAQLFRRLRVRGYRVTRHEWTPPPSPTAPIPSWQAPQRVTQLRDGCGMLPLCSGRRK
jgi:hypothetical protein